MKICILGCGLRTPLLLHGLVHSGLDIDEIVLYDSDSRRSLLMAEIGGQLSAGHHVRIHSSVEIQTAIQNGDFIISSIRVGNMETRAADERLALECGFAGQETTGPAGFAMALRTIPAALEYARIVERFAPSAWIVNFTNPAGVITQAISTHTRAKVIGVCDTPAELFYQIARALNEPLDQLHCDYFGLNHLGWVRSVFLRGENVMGRLLGADRLVRHLYPTQLFDFDFLQTLALIPTEYLFFYYNQGSARENQRRAGATRGEELQALNGQIWEDLQNSVRSANPKNSMDAYRRYLNRRNSSYMRLEGAGESAFGVPDVDWDPFEGATGYHRIAVEAIKALMSTHPTAMVLNVPNRGAIKEISDEDVVEVSCLVDQNGARPLACGSIPERVRGLMLAVKSFERLTIQASVEKRWDLAALALATNPIVGSWEGARQFLRGLAQRKDREFTDYLKSDIL